MSPTFWKVRAIPAATRWWAGASVMSSPRNRTRPVSGRRNPLTTSNSVVLPAPLGPMMPTISSSLTSRETSRSACTPPKRTEAPSTSSTGPDLRTRAGGRDGRRGGPRRDRPPKPLPERAEHLAEAARVAGQREDQQQRAEHQGGEVGRQVGQDGDGVDDPGQGQLGEEVVGEREQRRRHDDPGPAAEPAYHRHDHEQQRQLELELAADHGGGVVGQEGAGDGGKGAGDGEGDEGVAADASAEAGRH